MPVPTNPPWLVQLQRRFVAHWGLKAFAIPAFMVGFFVAYFYLLQNPRVPAMVMPLQLLDEVVRFWPLAIVPYVSLWFYVVLPPAFIQGRREIGFYCSGVAVLTFAGLGTFYLWPTVMPALSIDWAAYPSFGFLKSIDAAGNACPSLHVAFALFSAVWLERMLRQVAAPTLLRLLNGCWSAAIIYSTLATKQHVAVDLVAGVGLGAAVGFFDQRAATAAAPVERHSPWNRQLLAFTVSLTAKLTIVALDLWPAHPFAAITLFLLPDGWILAGLLIPNVSALVPTVRRFETARREVWLTIDDGPEPATTPAMLALLERHGARATFFLIGEKVAAYPELVTEILRHGHDVGNHTRSHPLVSFWMAGPWRTAAQVDDCHRALDRAGASTRWFRPPAGIKTLFLRRVLAQRDLVLVGWTARGRETASRTIAAPLRRLVRGLCPGAIILLHESARQPTLRIDLLSGLLDRLHAEGYRCVLPDRSALR